ncbi:MAG: biotin/lipoyl-binding protein, partial [Chloroflexota bacterium]
MHLPNKRIPIVLAAVALLAVLYFAINGRAAGGTALQASGTIEAEDVLIAPELSGRVSEVLVDKGQAVQAGQALFRLDGTLLEAQRARAAAAYATAQANLATAQNGLSAADAGLKSAQAALEAAQAAATAERLPVQKSLDDLSINSAAARGDAARAVAAANRAVRDAVYQLDNFTVSWLQDEFTPVEGISVTKQLLDQARAAFEPYRNESETDDTREELKDRLDEAQSEYDSAVRRVELNAALEAAQSRLRKAEDDLSKLQDGPNPQ